MYEGPRGVYWFWMPVEGRRAWFALDSEGHIIPPGVRTPLLDETDADVVDALNAALIESDPISRRAHLQLVIPDDMPELITAVVDPNVGLPVIFIPPSPVPSGVSPAAVLLAARLERPA